MEEPKKKTWASWLLWLVLILCLSRVLGTKTAVSVSVQPDGLELASESGFTDTLKWADISEVELRDEMAYGTLVQGTDDEKEKSGRWENEEFGEYELFADAKLKSAVVCTEQEGRTVVLNFESEKSTASLYEAIVEKLAAVRAAADMAQSGD